jgi:uncharacterized protein YegJ (DUF2314 family)
MVKVDQGVFMVNSLPVPYTDSPDEFAEGIADKRLRGAVAAHRAWISVVAMGETNDEASETKAYRGIARMIAELAGPDCLAIYCPELGRCNEYDQKLLETLRSPDPLALFDEPTFAPVISVDGDDPRMTAAVAEARRRWPEFAAAFEANSDQDAPFIVKAQFNEADETEFMWVSVIRIEGETIHGVLENTPHRLRNVKQGQQVAVPLSALNDWLYVKGTDNVGGFTMKVIKEIREGQ